MIVLSYGEFCTVLCLVGSMGVAVGMFIASIEIK